MMNWFLENATNMAGILIGGFIAYHVYFLSKKIDLKDNLVHKDNVRKKVEPMLHEISKGMNSKVELINVKKYSKHYPQNNKLDKDGYTYVAAELKALKFDGVEFFCGVREIYKKPNGGLSLKKAKNFVQEKYNILEAGIVPYNWIEYVDNRGDEFSYRPQFFVRFLGLNKCPYKYFNYYKESDVYHKNSDPMDFKWRNIDVE